MKEWAEHELNIICGMPGIYIRIIYIYIDTCFFIIYIYIYNTHILKVSGRHQVPFF